MYIDKVIYTSNNKTRTKTNIDKMKNNKTKLLTIRLTEAELIKAKNKGRGNVSNWIRKYINR